MKETYSYHCIGTARQKFSSNNFNNNLKLVSVKFKFPSQVFSQMYSYDSSHAYWNSDTNSR